MAFYYSDTTKGFYNTTEVEYSNLPGDIVELTEGQYKDLLFELNSNNKVIVISNGVITTEDTVLYNTWQTVRDKRNELLRNSDHTQLPDYPGDKVAWAAYRQQLREIPQTFASAELVVFPQTPN